MIHLKNNLFFCVNCLVVLRPVVLVVLYPVQQVGGLHGDGGGRVGGVGEVL